MHSEVVFGRRLWRCSMTREGDIFEGNRRRYVGETPPLSGSHEA
jgi:hypothetical protein